MISNVNKSKNMANPINTQAVRLAERIPVEELETDQNQINQIFARLIEQQIQQRDADFDHVVRVIRHFEGELEMIQRELAEAHQQIGQDGVNQDQNLRRILGLMDRIQVIRQDGEEQQRRLNRLAELENRNREILVAVNEVVDAEVEAERKKTELIEQIRLELSQKIDEHDETKRTCVNASLKTHLAALLGMGVGALGLVVTGSPFLLALAAKANFVAIPGWGFAIYEKHLHIKSSKTLDTFERYVSQGVSPELAREMAKNKA